MKIIVLVKANQSSEKGVMPDTELLTKMGKYNEELAKAGLMLGGEGLHPSSKGVRVHYTAAKPTVVDGPFTEVKELVSGFWIWQVKDMAEAIEWARRAPFGAGEQIELRPIFEPEDFGDALTPELREKEEQLRKRTVQK